MTANVKLITTTVLTEEVDEIASFGKELKRLDRRPKFMINDKEYSRAATIRVLLRFALAHTEEVIGWYRSSQGVRS